jgi:hypothetical protein
MGFSGAECRNASQFLETTLGTASQEQLTAEFHQVASTSATQLRQSH